MRPILLSSLLQVAGSLEGLGVEVKFPLKVSENRRHLVGPGGAPFLYQADTP